MEAKLRQLMKHEGINSTRLAEILGIQASGISHIMSGRNKPSFDFLLKLLQRFPQINPDWLMLDKGPMYRDGTKNKTAQNVTASADSTGGAAAAGGGGMGSTGGTGGGGMGGAFPGGLFGPDDNDIIPSVGQQDLQYGQPSGQSGLRQAGYQGEAGWQSGNPSANPSGGHVTGRLNQPSASAGADSHQRSGVHAGGHAGVRAAAYGESSVYQMDRFAAAAAIERIVVFYKDKTFSEYQPE